jgi:hypothetical protein
MDAYVQEVRKSSPQVTTDAGLQQPDREVMMLGEDWREAYIDFIRDQRLPAGMALDGFTHVLWPSTSLPSGSNTSR